MKSIAEQAYILFCAALLLAGCSAPTPRERVTHALETGDALYLAFDARPLHDRLSLTYLAAERAVAESDLPSREPVQCVLAVAKLLIQLSGANDVAYAGASSSSLGEACFVNRIAVAALPESSGWLWNGKTTAKNHLAQLGELPGDTILAAALSVDFSAIIAELERFGAGKLVGADAKNSAPSPREILQSLSGDWSIAFTVEAGTDPVDPDRCGFRLSVPDRDGTVFRWLVANIARFIPEAKCVDECIYLPDHGGIAPTVIRENNGITLCSSPMRSAHFGGDNDRLRDRPEFQKALEHLPELADGAFYIADGRLKRRLRIGGDNGLLLDLRKVESYSFGVWNNRDKLLEIREISSDPLTVQALDDLALAPLLAALDLLLSPEERTEKIAEPDASELERTDECRSRLAEIWKRLDAYRKEHGRLPEGFGAAALEKAVGSSAVCGEARYAYFGSFGDAASPKLPLVVDPPRRGAHDRRINILFADGTVETVPRPGDTLKHLCSYLHTIYHYEESEFIRLIGRAAQLDAETE